MSLASELTALVEEIKAKQAPWLALSAKADDDAQSLSTDEKDQLTAGNKGLAELVDKKVALETQIADGAALKAKLDGMSAAEKAKGEALGTGELQLIGVADFLDAESLLQWGERAKFTKPEQVNATGELREGRTVLVKGLLIEAEPESRVNLLAVVGLAEDCG